MSTMNCWKVLETEGYYKSFIDKKIRPDEREWMSARQITLKTGSINTAEGSATVRVGNTSVVCGIKAEIAVPDLRHPDKGFIVPNVEMYPCCSPSVKPGAPGEKAIVTSKYLSDVIKSSNFIDPKTLCIEPNKAVWCLYCDVVCLDYDGNLPDSSLLALVAALKDTRLPDAFWDSELEKLIISQTNSNYLKINTIPTSTTFTIYNADVHLLDPTAEDESQGNGTLTYVLKDRDAICSIQKSGGEFLFPEAMKNLIDIAKQRAEKLTEIIQNANSM